VAFRVVGTPVKHINSKYCNFFLTFLFKNNKIIISRQYYINGIDKENTIKLILFMVILVYRQ
jgi:hypothetical protein